MEVLGAQFMLESMLSVISWDPLTERESLPVKKKPPPHIRSNKTFLTLNDPYPFSPSAPRISTGRISIAAVPASVIAWRRPILMHLQGEL
jgi:hypothetical protein